MKTQRVEKMSSSQIEDKNPWKREIKDSHKSKYPILEEEEESSN